MGKKPEQEIAAAEIAKKVDEIYKLLGEATDLADSYGLEFGFSPVYGMGGYYNGKGTDEYRNEYVDDSDYDDDEYFGWQPSSHSC